jgi:small-conductance mechanosensitive channel
MLGLDVPTLAATFLQAHKNELTALLTIAGTIVLAIAVDRALLHRGHRLATAVMRDELTPVLDTRLRFLRRLITLSIVVIGLLLALAQFGGLSRLAAGLLASGALIAAILGFAARQTLANLIAGVMLTITQPLRIGDRVTVEQETGTVEDVRLNYTVVRGGDGGRIFIPNERLAAGILHNDTIVEPLVVLEVELWLPAAVDADAALGALASLDGGAIARIAEIGSDGVRYSVARGTIAPGERPARESELRADALRALRTARLLAADPPA